MSTKNHNVMIASVVFMLFASWSYAATPAFKTGVYLYDGSDPLTVDLHSTPFAVDWNNDGKKDLLVGQYVNGHIRLFLNQGTDLNPLFQGSSFIESNGEAITTTFG